MVKNIKGESFGDFFRRLRRAKGYRSQKDLAAASGVSQTTISRIEDGTQTPQHDTVKALAETLGVYHWHLIALAEGWEEDDLLEPVDKEKMLNSFDSLDNYPTLIKEESSVPYENEKELLEIAIEDLAIHNLTFNGHTLTDDQKKKLEKILWVAAQMLEK